MNDDEMNFTLRNLKVGAYGYDERGRRNTRKVSTLCDFLVYPKLVVTKVRSQLQFSTSHAFRGSYNVTTAPMCDQYNR